MADFTVERNCEVLVGCAVTCDSFEKGSEICNKLEHKLRANAQEEGKKDVRVEAKTIDIEVDEEGDFAHIDVYYSYTERCDCYKGYPATREEPAEPTTIDAEDHCDKAETMSEEIQKAFKDEGFDCFDDEILENNIEKLSDLRNKEGFGDTRDPDFARACKKDNIERD